MVVNCFPSAAEEQNGSVQISNQEQERDSVIAETNAAEIVGVGVSASLDSQKIILARRYGGCVSL